MGFIYKQNIFECCYAQKSRHLYSISALTRRRQSRDGVGVWHAAFFAP